MDDAWIFGPFMIKEKWALYAIAFMVSYTAVRLAIKLKAIDRSVLESLWNGFFLFLVVWKLSYTLFHPIDVFKNPISQLYFTGGEKGVVAAFIAVIIYFLSIRKNKGISFHVYMETGLISIVTAIGVFQMLAWVMYYPGLYHLIVEVVLSFMLIFYWFITYKHDVKPLWMKMLVWFSLGELFISYFKPQIPIFLGFSFSQLVYIVICLLIMVISVRLKRNFIKT
ncbi:hypothetical protein [Oceanobacillus sp. CAU 1775]